ncbi:hypothetical protein [Arcanobacterium bovis]|uniref:hypothetical protein n=1 Tax=Arcanobacterium bovis TaxID=2529275 RepID=UPI0013F16851|nr:hypothetical protein [Arcanobacterium bovis]
MKISSPSPGSVTPSFNEIDPNSVLFSIFSTLKDTGLELMILNSELEILSTEIDL